MTRVPITRRWAARVLPSRRLVSRARVAALVFAVVAWASTIAVPADADTPVTPGSGSASGQVFALNIPYGGLSIGVAGGEAKANYFDRAAFASAYTFNPKVLGLVKALNLCDGSFPFAFPPPTTASTDANGGKAQSNATRRTKDGSADLGAESASATPGARGVGDSTLSGFGLPGVVTITGGDAHSETSVDSQGRRRAVSTVEIGTVAILGGIVKMGGLRWRISQRVTGADSRTSARSKEASFTLGSASVAGIPFPTGSQAQVDTFIAAMNKATASLGLQVRMPRLQMTLSGHILTPLTLAIGGKTTFGPALNQLLAGANGLSVLNLFNMAQGTLFDAKACNQLAGAFKSSPQLNYMWNLVGALTPIFLSAVGAAFNGGAEVDVELGGISTAIDDTYYPPPPVPPGGNGTLPNPTDLSDAVVDPPVGSATMGALPVPAQTVSPPMVTPQIAPVRAVCRTTSEAGRQACWSGAAHLAAWSSLALVLIIFAADEGWRRKRRWLTIKKEMA